MYPEREKQRQSETTSFQIFLKPPASITPTLTSDQSHRPAATEQHTQHHCGRSGDSEKNEVVNKNSLQSFSMVYVTVLTFLDQEEASR